MAETGVQFTIAVSKVGTGGAQAAAELQAVAQMAAQTNSALAAATQTGLRTASALSQIAVAANQAAARLAQIQTTMTWWNNAVAVGAKGTAEASNQLNTLGASTKTTTVLMKSMGGVLTLAGFQQFPQLTTAAMLTKSSLDAVRLSGVNLTVGLGLATAGIAGLAAAVVSATFAWSAYKAEQESVASAAALNEQTERFAQSLREQVALLREKGRITAEQQAQLTGQLRTGAGGNQAVRDFMTGLDRGNAGQLLAGQQQTFAYQDAAEALGNPRGLSRAEERVQIQKRYNAELALQADLLQQGLLTEQQMMELGSNSDIKRMQSLTKLNAQLTDTQILGQQVAQTFAAGLSSALVNVFTEGGKALADFFRQFMQQVAQMILQLLIMRALKSSFGSALGLAAGGFAAPVMAANGLAGVSEVSGATYFPRFNVVAGEAGREMMTVLARPRFMEVGGVQAVVGNAGGNRLAITDADQLANAGGGGVVVIEVRHSPETEARIVENSVKGAVVRVTSEMSRDTKLSRVTKQL